MTGPDSKPDMKPDPKPDVKPDPKRDVKPGADDADPGSTDYIGRLNAAWKSLLGALAAVGGFAVGKFAFDKLGRGPTDQGWFHGHAGVGFALIGMLLFILGVIAVASTFIWLASSSRVSWAYLLRDENLSGWRGKIPSQIRATIERHASFYLGKKTTLEQFGRAYREEQAKGPTAKAADYRDRVHKILQVAAIERTGIVGFRSLILAVVGSLFIGTGAWMFLVSVNSADLLRADQVLARTNQREDELRRFPSGEVLPRTPSEVTLLIPAGTPAGTTAQWKDALTDACLIASAGALPPDAATPAPTTPSPAPDAESSTSPSYNEVDATVVDVGVPTGLDPLLGGPEGQAVFEIVTERSLDCPNVVVGWVPPSWVVERTVTPTTSAPAAATTAGG